MNLKIVFVTDVYIYKYLILNKKKLKKKFELYFC